MSILRAYTSKIFLCSLCSVLYAFNSGWAYDFIGSKWTLSAGGSVPYTVNTSLSVDLSDELCLTAVQSGFQVWTDLPCSYMTWRYEGRTQNTNWGTGDGENVVSWRENSWDDSSAALAITSSIFDFQGFIDTDLKYNGYHHTWAVVGMNGFGTDVESVTAHEVGHAIGLDHSNVSGSTMWPSTGPNDTSGRSLSQDDIDGACALYPSGGEAPMVPNDPPPMQQGSADFGESCAQELCVSPLFCVSDGMDQFCSQNCDSTAPCPNGYYCAQLSSGNGACAPGESPEIERVGFDEPCGEQVACEAGLVCISDGVESYCSGPCNQGLCPEGMQCAGLQGGGDICARGSGTPAPFFGEVCEESGRCDEGLFCLNDPLYVSAVDNQPIPYCSRECGMGCPQSYRCVDLQPSGDACQKIPTAGERGIGDPCWQNPELPFEDPTCGDNLRCSGSRRDSATQELIDPGVCTSSCTTERCCPEGWGCAAVTPFLALCVETLVDDEGFECMGERPELSPPTSDQEEDGDQSPEIVNDTPKDSGCNLSNKDQMRNISDVLCLSLWLMLLLLIRVKRYEVHSTTD